MLVLRRRQGQWVEITHKATGDVIRVLILDVRPESDRIRHVNLAFDDDSRQFDIQRAERINPATTIEE